MPGAGKGYRVIQFTASSSPGSSGGVVLDSRGAALAPVVGALPGGQNLNFAVPFEGVLGLADAAPAKNFASGSGLALPSESRVAAASVERKPEVNLNAPERSDSLNVSKDPVAILKSFKTMFVDARKANHCKSDQLQAALGRNKGFNALNIRIVDDYRIADVVLDVGYTFAWDFPFTLRHQNTSVVLVSGKGVGPFSGPAGAASVANELVKLLRPHRTGGN